MSLLEAHSIVHVILFFYELMVTNFKHVVNSVQFCKKLLTCSNKMALETVFKQLNELFFTDADVLVF